VFNRLLDIESQAFSDRDGSFGDTSSINEVRSIDQDTMIVSPIYIHEQNKKSIDMAVIDRIKALRHDQKKAKVIIGNH
jgi:hypothetical protein